MGSPAGSSVPQFATAEYAGTGDTCKSCNQAISGTYYRINGALACQRCTDQLKNQIPKDSHAAFVRALAFGFAAAIGGLILYAAFSIITGIAIGYVSLAVGWMIGKAMRAGSNGLGGRRYQIAAAAFTYAAVSMAAIPIYFSQMSKHKPAQAPHVQTFPSPSGSPQKESAAADPAASSQTGSSPAKPSMNPFAVLGVLVLIGLASPFLELQSPISGLIGLVILFVGIRFAWQQTGAPKLEMIGPFQARAPAPAASSAP
jgi:hypothetical protein